MKTKTKQQQTPKSQPDSFPAQYPNLAAWIADQGWVEIGYTEMMDSFVRVLDIGGMIWGGQADLQVDRRRAESRGEGGCGVDRQGRRR